MRANLDQALRRRILAELGVDVWRLRTGEPVGVAAVHAPALAPEASAARAGQAPRSDDAPRRGNGAGSGDRPAAGTDSPAHPGAAGIQPFSVLSLSAEGVTLLLERPPSGRESRLVRDLLAAATGRWDIEPAQRQFDWPPAVHVPGADGAGAADRALQAFVEKELADHGCTLVLLGNDLAKRLGRLKHAGERLVIPDLAVLGRESAEKRRLWSALGRYRLVVQGSAAGRSTRAPPGPARDLDGPMVGAADVPDGRT